MGRPEAGQPRWRSRRVAAGQLPAQRPSASPTSPTSPTSPSRLLGTSAKNVALATKSVVNAPEVGEVPKSRAAKGTNRSLCVAETGADGSGQEAAVQPLVRLSVEGRPLVTARGRTGIAVACVRRARGPAGRSLTLRRAGRGRRRRGRTVAQFSRTWRLRPT